jgi:hypothetical protein
MYKFLYYECGYGLYYIYYSTEDKLLQITDTNKNELLVQLEKNAESFRPGRTEVLKNTGLYISFEIINESMKFTPLMTWKELEEQITKATPDSIRDYKKSLRKSRYILDDSKYLSIFRLENLYHLPVKEDDLILFHDDTILPQSKSDWPVAMCKKYIKN